MENFFDYLDYSPYLLQNFVKAFSAVGSWMTTTVNIAGTDYSVLSLILGNGLVIYLGFVIFNFFNPLD